MENIFDIKEFQEGIAKQMKTVQEVQKVAYEEGYRAGYRAKEEETCKYSNEDKSERCAECRDILCPMCGYGKEGVRLCNECYASETSPQVAKNEPQSVPEHDCREESCAVCLEYNGEAKV